MPLTDLPAFRVSPADWSRDEADIARVRRAVFIDEQGVPEALEWEDRDALCHWFLARDPTDAAVGVCRLVPGGGLGRMAVLPDWRDRGVGTALLSLALAEARRRGWRQVWLHAQVRVMDFYARHGFVPVGEAFEEAGIAHRKMILRLEP